jgi:hypothetical protein
MKKLILSASAVLFGLGAFAQTPLGYGIKAGVNIPNYNFSNDNNSFDTKSSTNFHITGYLDAPITSSFYIQPGISLQGKGAKFADYEFLGEQYSITQNTMWIEVPVNAVAKFHTGDLGNFYIGAGPYAAFGISGKNKITSGNDSVDLENFEFGKDKDQKSFDAGINFLAGYQLSSGLTIGAGYGLGLSDIAPNGSGSLKQNNRVLSFSVGFAL